MTSRDVIDRWQARLEEWSRLHVQVDGAALAGEVIADLERAAAADTCEPLTYAKAAKLSGYSDDHIGRLVRDGKLKNVGRKGAPRVLASELPRKPASVLDASRSKSYDPASDARSLQRPAVRSDDGS